VGGVYAQNGSPPTGYWGGSATFHVGRSVTFITAGTTNGGYSTVKLPFPQRLPQGEFVLSFSIFNATKYLDNDIEEIYGAIWPQHWDAYQNLFRAKPFSRMHVEVQVVPTVQGGGPPREDAYVLPVPPDDSFIVETIEQTYPLDEFGGTVAAVPGTGGLPLKQSWKDIIDRYKPTTCYFVGDYNSGNSVSYVTGYDPPLPAERSTWEPALIEMRQYLLDNYPSCVFETYYFAGGTTYFSGAAEPSFIPKAIPGKQNPFPIRPWPNPSDPQAPPRAP
jgi:hypothetical protein